MQFFDVVVDVSVCINSEQTLKPLVSYLLLVRLCCTVGLTLIARNTSTPTLFVAFAWSQSLIF
eukprot:m.250729 g.250729  ORF g.250729 m.250729 type:complete len:63 (+) comp15442_c0_seq3:2428-2616(+)